MRDDEAVISSLVLTHTGMGDKKVQVNTVTLYESRHKFFTLFSSTPSASSQENKPGWPKIGKTPTIKSARSITSTSARLAWEESPRRSRPPSVSPSEGPIATPNTGSSMYDGTEGVQSTASSSETRNENYFVKTLKTKLR